jgi:hypothetical protein
MKTSPHALTRAGRDAALCDLVTDSLLLLCYGMVGIKAV